MTVLGPARPTLTLGRGESIAASTAVSLLAGWRAMVVVLALAMMPAVLGYADARVVPVGILCAVAAWLIALDGPPEDRPLTMLLFVLAFAFGSVALMAFTTWLQPSGGAYLSPDGQTYWRLARAMAGGELDLRPGAIATFRSFDVAAYYYFGALARFFGNQLFAVQLVNVGLLSLTAPLMFSWARHLGLRFALPLGLIIAVHPSLTFLAASNLLKDPSVVAASAVTVWAASRILAGCTWRRLALYALAAAPLYAYLRLGRFYVAVFLALAFTAGAVLVPSVEWLRRFLQSRGVHVGLGGLREQGDAEPRSRVAGFLVFVVLLGGVEATAVAAGWPPAPLQVAGQIHFVKSSPGMRQYSPGAAAWQWPRLTGPTNVIRRLYGPFVWVLPGRWDPRLLVSADYCLYPGMLLWYALLPFLAIGLVRTAVRLLQGAETRVPVAALLFFSLIYMAQFLMINLSHRQRDDVFPFLAVFAFLGLAAVRRWRWWRHAYALYWLGIVVMAAAHLSARGGPWA